MNPERQGEGQEQPEPEGGHGEWGVEFHLGAPKMGKKGVQGSGFSLKTLVALMGSFYCPPARFPALPWLRVAEMLSCRTGPQEIRSQVLNW